MYRHAGVDCPPGSTCKKNRRTAVQGGIGLFGTYSVNPADKSLNYQIEASTFPNWAGTTQKRVFAISGNEMTQSLAAGSAGGTVEIKLKRVK